MRRISLNTGAVQSAQSSSHLSGQAAGSSSGPASPHLEGSGTFPPLTPPPARNADFVRSLNSLLTPRATLTTPPASPQTSPRPLYAHSSNRNSSSTQRVSPGATAPRPRSYSASLHSSRRGSDGEQGGGLRMEAVIENVQRISEGISAPRSQGEEVQPSDLLQLSSRTPPTPTTPVTPHVISRAALSDSALNSSNDFLTGLAFVEPAVIEAIRVKLAALLVGEDYNYAPSLYSIQLGVANLCREVVEEYARGVPRGIQLIISEKTIKDSAKSVWRSLQQDKCSVLLSGILGGLEKFHQELTTSPTPNRIIVAQCLADMIGSAKIGLESFIRSVDKFSKNKPFRTILDLVLKKNMETKSCDILDHLREWTHHKTYHKLETLISEMILDYQTVQPVLIELQSPRAELNFNLIDPRVVDRCVVNNVVRYTEMTVNGGQVDLANWNGDPSGIPREFFTRVVTALYSAGLCKMREGIVQEHVDRLMSLSGIGDDALQIQKSFLANSPIAALRPLLVGSISGWMICELNWIRTLFQGLFKEIKTKPLKEGGMACHFNVNPETGRCEVEIVRDYEIFWALFPEDDTRATELPGRLGTVTFRAKISPPENDSAASVVVLKVEHLSINDTALAEQKWRILKAFFSEIP